MTIAVCVKQIPELSEKLVLDENKTSINRSRKIVLDDADRYGVEVGLLLSEQFSTNVILFCVTPDDELAGIREALAMGANEANIIKSSELFNSNATSVADVLAQNIKQYSDEVSKIDLVICGVESSDTYSGIIPSSLAFNLNYSLASNIKNISFDEASLDSIKMVKQTEENDQVIQVSSNVVISVTGGIVDPRYPNFKGIMEAKNKPINVIEYNGKIDEWQLDDISDIKISKEVLMIEDDGSETPLEEIKKILVSQGVL